ncbi:hypothetical protein Pse7367_0948 [Thalassoporum mexicanum PCC 7367]|uniref:hypothetical protein n=1 Tax=Thalassoporum mexicanum TaxID=3457544 RepID=UPI00029F9DDD|nr:hypothetical protein [Pseudanabaena sp. PCC 7367]AFY69248.1 hypothetical protein Pse7367_0948 [Pseudanabaena sp. PCC 7367]
MKASRVETIISAIVITAAIGLGIPVTADQSSNVHNRSDTFAPQNLVAISNVPNVEAPELDFIDYQVQTLATPTTVDSIFTLSQRDQIGCFISSSSIDGIVTCGQIDNY